MTITKDYNWSAHYLPRSVLALYIHYLEFSQPSKVEITITFYKFRSKKLSTLLSITHTGRMWLSQDSNAVLTPTPTLSTLHDTATVVGDIMMTTSLQRELHEVSNTELILDIYYFI